MAKTEGAKPTAPKSKVPVYEEWKCQIKGGKAEKLKRLRAAVKISDEQAEILNDGRIKGGNAYANLYFLPETPSE